MTRQFNPITERFRKNRFLRNYENGRLPRAVCAATEDESHGGHGGFSNTTAGILQSTVITEFAMCCVFVPVLPIEF